MKKDFNFSSFIKYLLILIVVITGYLRISSYVTRYKNRKMRFKCIDNCYKMENILHKFANKNGDKFPEKLSLLIPEYIDKIPECPSAKIDTFSDSYRTSVDGYTFTFYCKGDYHVKPFTDKNWDLFANYPKCSSNKGVDVIGGHLVLKPNETFERYIRFKRSIVLFKRLVKDHPEILKWKSDGNTILHLAAKAGRRDIVELLISKGMDVNARNKEGKTPLDLAEKGEVVELLKHEMNKK